MVNRAGVLERLAAVNQAALPDGVRAPHQPLALLYAFGRLQRTGSSLLSYEEAEEPLGRLFDEFGPPATGRAALPAALPFAAMDRTLWQPRGDDPNTLRGALAPDMEIALRSDPGLLAAAARQLLESNFPVSYEAAICAGVGLDLVELEAPLEYMPAAARCRRRAGFRTTVLAAYGYACAMCGYDGRLGSDPVGLDAAHVRWHALGGPDEIGNALALCELHKALFDLGVLGLTPDLVVRVSPRFVATGETADRQVRALQNRQLQLPDSLGGGPDPRHVEWHGEQVFKAAPLVVSS